MTTYPLHLLTVLIIIYLTLCTTSQESENNLFQVEDDSQKVERRLIDFILYRDEQETIARKFWIKISKKNICNRSSKFRRELCRRIMQYEVYGFEEDTAAVDQVLSMKRTFDLKFYPLERNRRRITMFWCPAVNYFNLETGSEENFPLFYNISRARGSNALFVYVQQENLADDPIYPRQYIHNVRIKTMKKLMKKSGHKADPSVPEVKINADCKEETVIPNTLKYIEAIRDEYTYRKFARMFASVSVCFTRRTHKIHLCRLTLKHYFPNVELDILGYRFPRCRKHTFHFDSGDHRIEAQLRGSIYALPCPPLKYKSIVPARFIISPILHFISSTLQPDSILMYSRFNKYQYDLQLKCYFDQMQVTQLFAQDVRRAGLFFYPYPAEGVQPEIHFSQEDYYTVDVSKIDSARGSVKMPSTIEKDHERDEALAEMTTPAIPEEIGEGNGEFEPDEDIETVPVSLRPIRIIYDRWFTEYAVLSFHKVQQEKLVYQKFKRTYTSIDVCNLTNRQKNELCNEFLKDHGFTPDLSPSDEAIDYPCARQEITLSRQEAEYLGSQTFSMWQCPSCGDGRGKELTFYVGKSNLKDAAIVYKLSHFEGIDFIHPDLFVSHVNRYTLADAVMLAQFDRKKQEAREAREARPGTSRGSGGIGGLVRYESFLSRGSDLSEESVPLTGVTVGR